MSLKGLRTKQIDIIKKKYLKNICSKKNEFAQLVGAQIFFILKKNHTSDYKYRMVLQKWALELLTKNFR